MLNSSGNAKIWLVSIKICLKDGAFAPHLCKDEKEKL